MGSAVQNDANANATSSRRAEAGLVIVGASYAGMQVAAAVRAKGYTGRIRMVGDEAVAPYQRPPLSKGLLLGKSTPETLTIRAPSYFEQEGIELLLGHSATAIDRAAQQVVLAGGERWDYDWLVLATGARCRTLAVPGAQGAGVYTLRNLQDGLDILSMAAQARSVCVVGGGFIGLEVASALVVQGVAVQVLEGSARVLARAVPPQVSQYVQQLHTQRGVQLHLGVQVQAIERDAQGAVVAVLLHNGQRIACDAVVVGIGVQANDALAAQAGLDCQAGVLVDACGRTADPRILAAGDCARFPNPYGPVPQQPLCLESIQAANDLARAVASVIVGAPQPYHAVPWFWSDQYDTKLQIAGLAAEGDETVLRGDPASGRFSLFLLRQGQVVCVHSINSPAEHLLARKLIEAKVCASPQHLADKDFALKQLLASEASAAPRGGIPS